MRPESRSVFRHECLKKVARCASHSATMRSGERQGADRDQRLGFLVVDAGGELGSAKPGATAQAVKVSVKPVSKLGPVLVDEEGKTLYVLRPRQAQQSHLHEFLRGGLATAEAGRRRESRCRRAGEAVAARGRPRSRRRSGHHLCRLASLHLRLAAAVAMLAAGLVVSLPAERLGVEIAGAGLLLQALWLARYDVARRTVRMGGVTRYMAAALLAGYVWLGVGGVLWIAGDPTQLAGFAYDASLHAIFLGFVMSMVFAHAPVIVPAVLGVKLPYHRGFYIPLALLHASLALRLLGGDLAGNLTAWQWGGGLNEVAILLFFALVAQSALHARRKSRKSRQADLHIVNV